MKFRYSAKTKDGYSTQKGEIEAPTREAAIDELQKHGLLVFSLVQGQARGGVATFLKNRKVNINDKARITEQLAGMLTAGLPIAKSLEILISQTEKPKLLDVLKEALNDIESGTPLSKSFAKHPNIFSISYISLIEAGEASGKLDEIFVRLAETLEKQRDFRAKVKGALMYPAIISIAMVAVLVIVIVFIVPQMTTLYSSMNVELPVATRALISLSDFVINSWWIVIGIVVAIAYSFKLFKSTDTGTYTIAKASFKIPIFGELVRQSGLVEFSRTLALLLDSGVPIIDSLEIVKNAAGNVLYRDSIAGFIEDVKHGYPLSTSIAKNPLFPQLMTQMVVVGEETGTVSERFNSLANHYEKEVDQIVKNLSTAIEPIIMIILGVMVAVLIFAVITPIYQLISAF